MFMCNHAGSNTADSTPQSGRLIRALRLALLGTGKPALALNRRQTPQSPVRGRVCCQVSCCFCYQVS